MLITDVRYFKPQIVTALFRANDLIGEQEEVTQLNLVLSGKTEEYNFYRFSVQYKDFRTQRHAPDHIQLKVSFKGATQAKREIDFYERIVMVMKRRVKQDLLRFPTAYDTYYDETSDQFHIILEDLSKEYSPSADKAPPTDRHREHVMDTLAVLHSYWWEHPLLEELETLPTEESISAIVEDYQAQLANIKRLVGKYLDAKHLGILDKIAKDLPSQRKERLLANKGLTIIHNNLKPENLLYSIRETHIVNWQHWAIGIGTDDLATMIPFNWPSHLRQYQEKQLLKRYYDTIIKRGVSDYSWANFEYDYKASLAHVIGKMLSQWTYDEHTRGHWRMMESAINAFIEMDGISVFEG